MSKTSSLREAQQVPESEPVRRVTRGIESLEDRQARLRHPDYVLTPGEQRLTSEEREAWIERGGYTAELYTPKWDDDDEDDYDDE